MKARLSPDVFKFTEGQISKIAKGWFSDKFFVRTKEVLELDKTSPRVLMQIFTRKVGVVCGIDEVIAILKLSLQDDFYKLKVEALHDGDIIQPWESVMTIEGDYPLFAHLETVYLGILARRTKVATNVKKIVDAACGRGVLFFPARFDHWMLQTGDGYAAHISGALGNSTDANCDWWGSKGIGTIPHGLIAAYRGSTVKAALKFDEYMPENINRVVLVDYDNDCIKTAVDVISKFRAQAENAKGEEGNIRSNDYIGSGKGKIWGVRFDTSGLLRDKSVTPIGEESLGVCSELCWKARKYFDKLLWQDLRIIVSGGFNEEKVRRFIKLDVPVDIFGVGSSLFDGNFDYTADIVKVNGQNCAKVGRGYNPNSRLERVE